MAGPAFEGESEFRRANIERFDFEAAPIRIFDDEP